MRLTYLGPATPPVKECRYAERDQPSPDRCVPRIGADRTQHDVGGCQHEKSRRHGISWNAKRFPFLVSRVPTSINEESRNREPKEDPVSERDVIHELTERAGQCEDN